MTVLRQVFHHFEKFCSTQKCVNSLQSAVTWRTLDKATMPPYLMVKRFGKHWKLLVRNKNIVMRGFSNESSDDAMKRSTQGEKLRPLKKTNFPVCLRDILTTWVKKMRTNRVPEPEESASLIVAHVFGKKMIHEVDLDVLVTTEVLDKINSLCQQRLQRAPVQYIIGEWDFHDMTLKLEPGVLIPRPETEELGSHVVNDLSTRGKQKHLKVLDIGCGCGALCLYILKSNVNTQCVAVDKSQIACNLTRINAEDNSLQDRLDIIEGNIFEESCIGELIHRGPYDVIVSNPPYIPAKDMDALEPEVSRYEDHAALYGGIDGLDVITQIFKLSKNLLQPKTGLLWLEVDPSHPVKVEEMVTANPQLSLKYIETVQDFTKRERFCKLQAR